jgi:cytoskeletal protein RodZ
MRVDTGRLRVVPPELLAEEEISTDDGIPSPGRYVREHRTRLGMSVDDLSRGTKIPRQSLELLESDRFEELPGPVFTKGFLRCCARSLGLEPERLLELLYERERALSRARKERPTERPTTGNQLAVPRPETGRTRPVPSLSASAILGRFLSSMTATNILLWIVVALFLGVLAMAVFNLGASAPADVSGG